LGQVWDWGVGVSLSLAFRDGPHGLEKPL